MKKIFIFCCVALYSFALSSCDDMLKDELFVKYAYVVQNGWKEVNLELNNIGVMSLPITVGVNGTSFNNRDVAVKLALDPDTLADYNFNKYKNDEVLYYKQINDEAIKFPEEVVIESGKESAVIQVTLDKSKIENQYADYVLPVCIASAEGYDPGPTKYTRSLMHLSFYNDFSGSYGGSCKLWDQDKSGSLHERTISSKILYGYSPNECYFYAGEYDRTNIMKDGYIVRLNWDPETGEVLMTSDNTDMRLTLIEPTTFKQVIINHATDDSKKIVTTTLFVNYSYLDASSSNVRTMVFKGTMTMTDMNVPVERPGRVDTPTE